MCGDDRPAATLFDQLFHLLGRIAAQHQFVFDPKTAARTVDVKSNTESFHPAPLVPGQRPHVRVDGKVTTTCRPGFGFARRHLGRRQVHAQQIQAANPNRLAHALHMPERRRFAVEMPKTVDRIERDVIPSANAKVGHVRNKRSLRHRVPTKSRIAKLDRLFIQIQPGDRIASLGKRKEQTPRPACRLEQAGLRNVRFSTAISLATSADEFHFGRTVGTKNQVVILGMIVNRFVQGLDERSLRYVIGNGWSWATGTMVAAGLDSDKRSMPSLSFAARSSPVLSFHAA
mgnify:CR=1 FL=1